MLHKSLAEPSIQFILSNTFLMDNLLISRLYLVYNDFIVMNETMHCFNIIPRF